jgi:hypothetical protein
MPELTHLLCAIAQGDPHAAARLLPLVYDELRRLAAAALLGVSPSTADRWWAYAEAERGAIPNGASM